jgi:hypothetical protein
MRELDRFFIILLLVSLTAPAVAHEPYIERDDYSVEAPFVISDSIENSKAIYAWLDNAADIDVYAFEVKKPLRLYAKIIVQACEELRDHLPWLALAGPGLPMPDEPLPFDLPEGYGAYVIKNVSPGEQRETFYEVFSGKSYYDGPLFDREVTATGSWFAYCWDPQQKGGDYVAIFGFKENFSLLRIGASFINTLLIRRDRELHVQCTKNNKS